MRRSHITRAGQLSVPAAVRRRWDTEWVLLEDHGDYLIVRPTAEDPIAAARGSLKGLGSGLTSDEMRRLAREDERHAEEQKLKRLRRS
jgi:hypothetical protein